MEWRDEGALLGVRRHGENGVIIDTLTREHGRHAGMVRGGRRKDLAPILQPGAQLQLRWTARLDEHLGQFEVEPLRERTSAIMNNRTTLAGFNAMSALIMILVPEREPNGRLFEATMVALDAMAEGDWDWPALYARWELVFLGALGYPLDLSRCAATGSRDDLVYVSPKSGRAVSREAGGPWADKMLPLPSFLTGPGKITNGAVREAMRMTGWFLEHWACPGLGCEKLPEARARLLQAFEHLQVQAPPKRSSYNEDEESYNRQMGVDRVLLIPTSGG
ncbi:MAG: DNA repair protein RecO [Pseudomonadota bacterium]